MLTDAPLPPSLPHHLNSTTHDHDDASTAASSANTPVLVPIPHDREASTDGPSPEVPPTLADESIDHVNAHLKGEDSDMHDHSAAGINAPGKAPAASTLGSKTTIDVNARAASASGDDMEIDGESNIDSDDNDLSGFDPATLTDLPRLPSSSQVNGGVHPQQPQFTPKTHSPSPSHSRSRSPNGIALHGSMSSDANTMPVDASIPRTPALQDSQPDDASMADGERPAKRPRNAYEESSTSQPLPSSSSNPAMQPAAPRPRPTKSVSTAPFTPGQLKYALSTVKQLKKSRDASAFLLPVDPVALNIPHYPSVITHPMDLGTVEKKLNATKKGELGDVGFYQNPDEFVADVRLVWANCHAFNGPQSIFSQAADRLSDTFERQMAHFPPPEEVKPAVPAKRPSPAVSAPPKPKVTAPRRPSTSIPAARRDVASPVASSFASQSNTVARPKREVHAPPPKDSGYYEPSRTNGAGRRAKRDDGTAEQLKYCLKIINGLFGRQYENWAWFFYDPVDKAIVPGYYDVIKKPMDMNTIKRKLEQDGYANANQFYKDFRQLIENCYTFNPAGTVREAGHKLEEEFNRRWANLPPLRPAEDSEPESEEDDAQSDVEQEKLLRSLEEQVTNLNRNIESLKASIRDKKKRRERAREERRQAKLARQASYRDSRDDFSYGSKPAPKKGRTSSASQTNGSYKAAAASPVASSSKQHHKPAAKAASKKASAPAPAPVAAAVEDDEFDAMDSPLDMAQKKELSEAIEKLEGDKLEKVISIIQDGVPGIGNNSEEIELEIDALPSAVLQRLYSFVIRPLKAANKPINAYKVPKRAGSGNTGRTGAAATGGVKRKSMDEDAESRKIAELEAKAALLAGKAQPNQQQPGSSQHPRGPGIGNGADEDESAQSSDESGSEEESDSD